MEGNLNEILSGKLQLKRFRTDRADRSVNAIILEVVIDLLVGLFSRMSLIKGN